MPDQKQILRHELHNRYRLEREVGRGGMATVYLAHDIKHDRPVALKVLHPGLANALGAERFLREIRTTARLQHPNILPVLDSGEAAGQLWYTMPYVEGESLRDRLRRESQLPVDEALRLTREVADALAAAHAAGILHRDIKPENILLSHGHALVADFGLAGALDAGGRSELTSAGMVVGTPKYMSPEQAGSDRVDARSDLYSVGCVLYEMLAGEPPFTGPTPQAILAKRALESVPRVRTVRETVPEQVEQALNRALAKVPADRFQTAAEFAHALAQPFRTPGATHAPAASLSAPEDRTRHVHAGVVLLALGVLLGIALLLAWPRIRPQAGLPGPRRVAVLPFENLGRPEDEYFADGVTDAVRGKLAALPGLEVIARASSAQYKQSAKSPQQIGQELGVEYLLAGTVRWANDQAGQSRVQVSPELVRVATASTKWQQAFDAALTDVFQVQGDIAARVAEALGVALGTGERERLAERPTQNLAAYDAFLKGEAALSSDFTTYRRAIDYYERAVALDSTFALAWAQLSLAHSRNYCSTPAADAEGAARSAAARALALKPQLPEAYYARAFYYYCVHQDISRALKESKQAWELAPNDARFLVVYAQNEIALGHTEEALRHLRQVQTLDPRSVETTTRTVYALIGLRRYAEAQQAAERGLSVAPTDLALITSAAEVHLAQGNLAGARSVLKAVPRGVDPAALVSYVATFDDLYWVLDDAQQRLLLRLSPALFGEDRVTWSFALTQTYAYRGDSVLTHAYADSTRLALEDRLRSVPQDPGTHSYLGLALAYLGRKADAIREGERGLELVRTRADREVRGYQQYRLVRIYLLTGEPERALDLIQPMVESQWLSPGMLRIDPTFATLRGNPRFERLARDT